MKVLVACEFSGIVREAFRTRGHDAFSCDLVPDAQGSPNHIIEDALRIAYFQPWDLMIAHPPCTSLSYAGARWFKGREVEQSQAIAFVRALMQAPIPKIAIENPRGLISKAIRPPDQIIQPWQFGHVQSKATCLWLKGLPSLVPTDVVDKSLRMPGMMTAISPGEQRGRQRSVTFPGVAEAMASQWGGSSG